MGEFQVVDFLKRSKRKEPWKPGDPYPNDIIQTSLRISLEFDNKLEKAAARRGMTKHNLIRRILTVVIDDGLLNAVLDDGKEETNAPAQSS